MRKFIDLVEQRLPLIKGTIPYARSAYGAFVVVMRPRDFLELTTENDDQIASIMKRDFLIPDDEFAASYSGAVPGRFDMPFLYVQFPSGRISGHEGRHRTAMVMKQGGTSIPVMIYPRCDDQWIVTDIFRDDEYETHTRETVFHSHRAASDHEFKMLNASLHNEPMLNDWDYVKSDVRHYSGEKLRGAPARSNPGEWQYASWRVEDFPDQLIGQFHDWIKVPKTRMKIGIVKGYRHHKEPGE